MIMPLLDDPQQLPLGLAPRMRDIDPLVVAAQPTLLAAIKLCISLRGFQADKQVYGPLGIDAGHWSRIHRGEANFPVDNLCELMDLCENEAPMLWLHHARGYDLRSLRKRETETERELREAREQIAALRRVLSGN